MLNRETFLQKRVFRTEDVDVPEMGDKLRVRMLTSSERFAASKIASASGDFDPGLFQAAIICFCVVGEDGVQVFNSEDATTIASYPSAVTKPIFDAAAKLNGMDKEAVDAAEKNSSASPSAASS